MTTSPLAQSNMHNHFRGLLLATTLFLAPGVMAQVGGIDMDPGDRGTGGKNTIQGTILVSTGQRLDRRVKVKLTGLAGGEQFTMSDDNGSFSFRRLQGGKYTIVVDAGKDFEMAAEVVDIIDPPRRRGDSGMVIPVYITLQPKGSPRAGAPGTVDAKTAALPDAVKDLYKQAMESAKAGDTKKAIEELQKALEIYPTFMAALNQLGVQYIELKEWEKAAVPLRKAIEISPMASYPRLNYGIVLVQLKKYSEAVAELTIAVQKDSSSGRAQFYLGRAMTSLGKYDAAENALRQAIIIGGDDAVEAHRYLGAVYIEKRDNARAAEELETYLKLAPRAKDAERIRGIIKDLRSQASTTPR